MNAIFLLVLFIFMGCATAEVGQKYDVKAAERIQIGLTTESEVLSWLGEPLNKMTMANGRKIFVYQHLKTQAYPGLLGIKAQGEGNMLGIGFDQEGIVRSISRSNTPISLGPGSGN